MSEASSLDASVEAAWSDPHGFGIYVHWPFCAAKCPYCDFNSHVRTGVDHDVVVGLAETVPFRIQEPGDHDAEQRSDLR